MVSRRTKTTESGTRPKDWPLSPEEEKAFWESHDDLLTIRDYAQANRAGPWSTLMIVLARVVSIVPPHIVLDSLGDDVTINLYVAVAGKPGKHKGKATRAAERLLPFPEYVPNPDPDEPDEYPGEVTINGVGSGEGIPHAYVSRIGRAKQVTQHHWRALIDIPEVDTLNGIVGRKSSTILPELRKGFMSELLGALNADPQKRLPVEPHRYRLAVIMGVQPEKARVLLDDEGGGTPQRFLWCSARDFDAPLERAECELPVLELRWPGSDDTPRSWQHPNEDPQKPRRRHIRVCDEALDAMDYEAYLNLKEEDGEYPAHYLMVRLKVATALCILLDDGCEVTEEYWGLAGTIMAVSDWQRKKVEKESREKAHEETVAKGAAEGVRQLVTEDVKYEKKVKRVRLNIVLKLKECGPMNRRDLEQKQAYRDRMPGEPYFAEALEQALKAREVVGDDEKYSLP